MSTVSQGHDFRLHYVHEDAGFLAAPNDSDNKPFGANAALDTAEGANNAQQVFGPASRAPIDIVEQNFEGSWSVSFQYTNPWWLEMLFGEPSTTDITNESSYAHTYDGEEPNSSQITIGREDSGKARVLSGCVATRASVQVSVGNPAQVTLEGAYADEEVLSPSSLDAQPSITKKPMTFADALLKKGGTTIGFVQQGTLSIQSNVDLLDEWGSRIAVDFSPKALTPQLNFEKFNEAGETTNLEEMYGGSTSVQEDVPGGDNYSLVLDNGKGESSGINKLEVTLTNTFPASYDEDGIGDPQADLSERLNRLAEGVSATATNETSPAR